jgi:hypothetical protein
MRSGLADGRMWREKGEKFSMGIPGPDQSEVMKWRLCGKKVWGYEGEEFCVGVWTGGQKVKRPNLENENAWVREWEGL